MIGGQALHFGERLPIVSPPVHRLLGRIQGQLRCDAIGCVRDEAAGVRLPRIVLGLGTETVGTDAGAAHSFSTPFPCHSFLLGAGKYGLTQLRNLDRLPPTGAVVIATPLPIVGGSGSPARVLALVERPPVGS